MTKSKAQPGAGPDIVTNPFAVGDVAGRAQAFWSVQGLALEHMRGFMNDWYARRRDAAAAAAECCTQVMGNGGDIPAVSRAWSEWTSGAMERLREDLFAPTALATAIVADMAEALSANGAARPDPGKPHAAAAEGVDATRAARTADVR